MEKKEQNEEAGRPAMTEAESPENLQELNEIAEERMREPVMFENLARRRSAGRGVAVERASATGFLSNIRPSVWD